ncbi:MAG: lactonase family protein [Bacteroidales bacterium]|nr:lactonase family protein [Bacteroidales bacterium]MBN2762127.1 lactonase family protein [Bacteroidales bacterium]
MFFVQSVVAGTAQNDTAFYCYVSLKGDNVISVYKINQMEGIPEKIYDEPVSGGPASLALHPSKHYLYVALRSANAISAYRIDPASGRLSPINSIPAVDNPVYISIDASGRFLLSAYFNASKAAIYPINSDGSLQSAASLTVSTNINPHAIITDPSNRFLYITNMTGNSILQYKFDTASGTIAPLEPAEVIPAEGTGPRHVVFHRSKNMVYVVNETGNSITAYHVNENGTLKAFQTISTLPDGYDETNKCADVHITPDNRFLFASNRGHESIAAFGIDPDTDSLTTIGHYNTVNSPREFDVDPIGTYLYAAGETSDNLAWYRIDKISGELDSLGCIETGKTPSWVLVAGFKNATTEVDDLLPESSPSEYDLKNCPNPFGSVTSIRWFLDEPCHIRVAVFDVSGRLVTKLMDGFLPGGFYSVDWKTENNKSDNCLYYCQLLTDRGCDVIKLVRIQ